jgi:membrane fusion protein (multidrug efflux system)
MTRSMTLACLAAASMFSLPPSAAAVEDAATDGRIRVQFAARHHTVLSSELSARIISQPLREGDAFKKGSTLVTFDCSMFRAQLNKSEASAEVARQTLKVNRRLAELNSIGSLEVDQAAAKVKETEAEAAATRAMVSKCTLIAPFSGRVAKVHAEPHQFVAPGNPLLEILDTRRLELQMIVPSRWLAWLKAGNRFTVQVEELDREYTGRVVRTGARIDPVSQSISLAGKVEGDHRELLPGMSGWATFKQRK